MSWWFWCCFRGRHRWVCIADNVNHLLPRALQSRRLCDRHDAHIVADVERGDVAVNQ